MPSLRFLPSGMLHAVLQNKTECRSVASWKPLPNTVAGPSGIRTRFPFHPWIKGTRAQVVIELSGTF